MKNLMMAICMVAFSTASFANNPETEKEKALNYRASQNLYQMFGKVDNLKWSMAKDNMYRADFVQEDENISAFFDVQGNYIANTRNMEFGQLPSKLRAAIKEKADVNNITTIFKLTTPSEESYFIEIKTGSEQQVWKCDSNGYMVKHRI